MKRLVELDPDTFRTKEVDYKKIRRTAESLKSYLLSLKPEEDTYQIKKKVLPIVDAVLSDDVKLPFDARNKPLWYEGTEGLLPKDYENISGPFWVAISGMSGLGCDLIQPIHKDGKVYVWMEFED